MNTKPTPDEELLSILQECVYKRGRTGILNTASAQQEENPQPKRESVFEQIERLSNQGLSARQIGKRIGVPRKVVRKYLER